MRSLRMYRLCTTDSPTRRNRFCARLRRNRDWLGCLGDLCPPDEYLVGCVCRVPCTRDDRAVTLECASRHPTCHRYGGGGSVYSEARQSPFGRPREGHLLLRRVGMPDTRWRDAS